MFGTKNVSRRGGILPMLVLCLTVLLGLVALAVDIGMLAVARTQCQAVADAVALSGARALNGDPTVDFNRDAVPTAANQVIAQTRILGQPVQSNQVNTEIGSYRYDTSSNQFIIATNRLSNTEAWSLVRATVNATNNTTFGRILGVQSLNASAVAVAAHRPRDVAIVIDFSGSMRLNSLLGAPITDATGLNLTSRNRAMNVETAYPTFGHWTNVSTWRGTSAQVAFNTATGESVGPSNFTQLTDEGKPIIEDFFQDASPFGSSTKAFTQQPTSYGTTPGGMNAPRVRNSTSWAINVNEVALGATSSALKSLAKTTSSTPFLDDITSTNVVGSATTGYGNSFVDETVGPNYWGKTFYVWPPDPRGPTNLGSWANNGAKDWRQRFFYQIYLGPRTGTSTTTTGGTGGGTGGGGTGGGGTGGGGSSPPPPPPPLNVVPGLGDGKSFFQFTTGSGLIVGGRYPLVNNNLMWNGGTNLTSTGVDSTSTSWNQYGDGNFRAPGSLTEFILASTSSSVTNSDGSVTTTTVTQYQRFTYQPNYDAILAWIKSGTQVAPPRMRAGGILYYDAIPDTVRIDVHPIPTTDQAGRNQRFWKEYIDEVLGIQQSGFTTTNGIRYAVYTNRAGRMGYGDFFAWPSKTTRIHASGRGLESISPPPIDRWNWNGSDATQSDTRYMDYRDNPRRPRMQFWFGGATMVDFLSNMNLMSRSWMPGTAHESPMWQCKAGVAAALNDIKLNHPNDLVSLIAFSKPEGYSPTTGSTLQSGSFNAPRSPLGRDYNKMINSLYFPAQVANTGTEITPFDAAITDAPKSIGGTTYAMGFMLAYNQFSRGVVDSDLRRFAGGSAPEGYAGGLGRRGAQKMVIFETDGVCSATVYAPGALNTMFTNNGPYRSWFKVRYDAAGSIKNEYPPYLASGATDAATQTLEVVQRLCAQDTDMTPGYSTRRKPVKVHTMGYGSLFETASANRTTAMNLLQSIQYYGGTQDSPSLALDEDKIIIGDSTTRINKMQSAFSKIMQDGYSVTLID
ncbi:MAG: Tad domain-containing protein [Gemmataceae bacterium]